MLKGRKTGGEIMLSSAGTALLASSQMKLLFMSTSMSSGRRKETISHYINKVSLSNSLCLLLKWPLPLASPDQSKKGSPAKKREV